MQTVYFYAVKNQAVPGGLGEGDIIYLRQGDSVEYNGPPEVLQWLLTQLPGARILKWDPNQDETVTAHHWECLWLN